MNRQLTQIEVEYKENQEDYHTLVKQLADLEIREFFGFSSLNGSSVYHIDMNNEGVTMVLLPAVRDYREPRVILRGESNAVSNLRSILERIITDSKIKTE